MPSRWPLSVLMTTWLGAAPLALGQPVPASAPPVTTPTPPGPAASAQPEVVQPLAEADHWRHPRSEWRYTEMWNYLALLDDGAVLSVNFLISNIGVFSGTGEVSIGLTRPGEQPRRFDEPHSPKEYREERRDGRFVLGPHQVVRRGDQTRILLRGERFSADLRLQAWLPGFKLGDGRVRFPGQPDWLHQVFVEIPRAELQGTVTLDGQTFPVAGSAYGDHIVQNVPATEWSDAWHTLRAFAPGHTVVLIDFTLPGSLGGGHRSLGFVADRTRVLAAGSRLTLSPLPGPRHRDPRGYTVPTDFSVELALGQGQVLRGSYRASRYISRNALLENLGWLERKAVAMFAKDSNPIIYRFAAEPELRLVVPGQPDLLLGGPAWHEVAVLR